MVTVITAAGTGGFPDSISQTFEPPLPSIKNSSTRGCTQRQYRRFPEGDAPDFAAAPVLLGFGDREIKLTGGVLEAMWSTLQAPLPELLNHPAHHWVSWCVASLVGPPALSMPTLPTHQPLAVGAGLVLVVA